MPRRQCLGCGRITKKGSRCRKCHRTMRGSGMESPQYRAARRALLQEHKRRFGYVCPGWDRESHLARDLEADHIVPIWGGGTHAIENLQVLCRSCNASKGASLADSLAARYQADSLGE